MTQEMIDEANALVKRHGSVTAAARAAGVSRTTLQGRCGGVAAGGSAVAGIVEPGDSRWAETGNDATAERIVSNKIKSLRELYAACEVDEKVWFCKSWECGAWNTSMKLKSLVDGKTTHKPITVQNFKIVAKFIRRVAEMELRDLAADLLKDFRSILKTPTQIKYRAKSVKYCMVIDVPDLHLGKLAIEMETGNTYNMEIAERLYLDAVGSLLEKAKQYDVEQIILPIGNDMMHVDGSRKSTTAGTLQDMAGSWKDMFRRTARAARAAIAMAERVAPVIVPIVDSNHDSDMVFAMGELLHVAYEGNKNVSIKNTPRPRLYEVYGANLLGFTHGHGVKKAAQYHGLMSHEAKQAWGGSVCREMHTGHLHQRQLTIFRALEEVEGIAVRISPSLSPADRWHTVAGYVSSTRGGEAFVYRREGGLCAQFCANVDPRTGNSIAA